MDMVKEAAFESVKITSMVFGILIGATAFSMVFSYTGGDEIVEHFMIMLLPVMRNLDLYYLQC